MTEAHAAQHFACLVGDIRTMRRACAAMDVLLELLRNDATAANKYRRHGLLTALELVAHSLDERANFLAHDLLKGDA